MHGGSTPAALVLIVEDEWIIAESISDTLRRRGYRVLGPAMTSAAALDLLQDETPDAVLLDAMLIGETSFAVADAAVERGVPVSFLSAYSREELPFSYSCCRILSKPFTDAALVAEVSALLSASQVRP